ncbi:methylated-DNA--[protein]-cysteine S-methyltransferase [Craterilacuibacter sp.]|uniref:methylated-DNA--[protein]-cysteine S-methyltransferase n=1 Tax=Craterilacuibacter sp. TaxID=2870909 RepID=UPI003F391E2C
MHTIDIDYFNTPCGELVLGVWQDRLCLCDWRYRKMRARIDMRIASHLKASYREAASALAGEAKAQLAAYFSGTRQSFDLPLLMAGSDFQRRVWDALLNLPYGARDSYLGLAKRLGQPEAVRAVAAANGANALAIIVPCHRIIGSHGELTGYAGGLPAKSKLLELESGTTPQLALFGN